LAAAATGTVANTATVSYANDPSSANNTATDTNTIVPQADLSITKTNGLNGFVPGVPVSYTIVVSNPAAAVVGGVSFSDTVPAALTNCTWSCTASGGSCAPASGSGNVASTLTLAASGSATTTLSCILSPTVTGSVSNTASISYVNDPNSTNNSATDTDPLLADGLFADGFEEP
ncbi:MAG: hypothetical protein ABIP94_03330, partial [Planctomycetota bacterium]